MSQENVEVMRALFEAWNAADMDAVHALYAPDVIARARRMSITCRAMVPPTSSRR
jgi:hypothetical protein